MIFITGDTHGGYPRDCTKFDRFDDSKLSKDDFLIIAGDFGFIWESVSDYKEKKWLKYFDTFKCTVCFIDGNHENFTRLNSYEICDFNGGKAHKISKNIYHLMRGEIFTLNERKIFTMGGALSIDKDYRTPGISWWEEEQISENDMLNAWENLAKFDFSVDLVITHTAPNHLLSDIMEFNLSQFYDEANLQLEKIYAKINFKKWYFGHFHDDMIVNSRFRCVFHDIVQA